MVTMVLVSRSKRRKYCLWLVANGNTILTIDTLYSYFHPPTFLPFDHPNSSHLLLFAVIKALCSFNVTAAVINLSRATTSIIPYLASQWLLLLLFTTVQSPPCITVIIIHMISESILLHLNKLSKLCSFAVAALTTR